MILGDCPYENCEGYISLEIPEDVKLPAYAPHNCEDCGKEIWTRFSRFDPKSYTKEAFFDEFEVDEKTHMLKPRNI